MTNTRQSLSKQRNKSRREGTIKSPARKCRVSYGKKIESRKGRHKITFAQSASSGLDVDP